MLKLNRLVVAALAILGLAGCGPNKLETNVTSNNKDTTVADTKTNDYDLLVWEDKAKSNGIKEAVEKFEQEHNVKIKVIEKAYGNQLEDLRLDGPAGTGADVITIPGDQIGTAVTEGLVKELSVDDAFKRIFTEAAMNSQIVNGKVYGIPKAVETQVMYYNKDLISESELPKTLDEWYEYSKKLQEGKYGLLATWDQIYYANGIITAYGGYIFGLNDDGSYNPEDIGLDNEGAIEAVEYISKFYKEGVFPAGIIGEQGINVLDSLFTEGKAVAIISGPWNLEPFTEAGINYGVKPLPLLANGKHMGSFIGVKSYNVSSYSKNAELAEKFVEFIGNEENSKVRYEITKEVPAVAALAESEEVKSSESALAIAEQSQYAIITPGITAMNSVWSPADSALQTIATGSADVTSALKQAVEQIKADIAASGATQ
ncbi:extracellular solute-binding protein [Aerococcaceae bacterium zg-BR22]|uniref:sugar ABC transporter substrate-binding protein n=1 Tax=Aerococcaceae bacterium zg-1292 TaxID=2774330 RepID=UPI004064750D|nr:extracellular solute-binding protein [Aerococcaceae bacterium zg-BR22]